MQPAWRQVSPRRLEAHEVVGDLLVRAEPVELDAVVDGDHELVGDRAQRGQQRGDPRRRVLGGDEDAEAQPATAATLSAWIRFCAPVRRASGSGASAPWSRSASR
jgi:hypothetical protein